MLKKLCQKPVIPSLFTPNSQRFGTIVKTLKDDIFTVSLIGRPNVGKSSLFNKLTGGRYALTDSLPGLTRDRKEIITDIFKAPVRLVDTAGWENEKEVRASEVKRKMMEQTAHGLIYSDLALFLVDVRHGITPEDIFLANWVRKRQLGEDNPILQMKTLDDVRIKKILLVGNKAENDYDHDAYADVFKLGFGDPIFISAEHGDGMHELLEAIEKEIPLEKIEEFEQRKKKRREKHIYLREKFKEELIEVKENSEDPDEINIEAWEKEFDNYNKNPEENSDLDSDSEVDVEESMTKSIINEKGGISTENFLKRKPIQISVVGRPNVGKSTFVNSLLKDNRMIASDLPGTTRDSISVQWVYKGRKVNLIDTAGINKRVKLKTNVEKLMQSEAIKAIQYSQVVVCIIDALDAFRVQDMSVAQYVIEEGRGLVLVVNKWDLVTPEWRSKASKFMKKQLERFLGETKEIPLHFVSALTNHKVEHVMDEVFRTYENWNKRISTGLLNDWLNRFKKTQNLPRDGNDQLKIRFITQIKSRPPTFSVFVNDKSLFKDNYLKYMKNHLATEFGLHGVPIRFFFRDTEYKQTKKRVEKITKSGTMKKMFLRQRRLARQAKVKLEKLGRTKFAGGSRPN